MQIHFKDTSLNDMNNITIFFISNTLEFTPSLKTFDTQNDNIVQKYLSNSTLFSGKFSTISSLIITANATQIILVGLGDTTKITKKSLNSLGAVITKKMNSKKASICNIMIDNICFNNINNGEVALYIAEGIKLRNYKFNKYFVNKKEDHEIYFKTANILLNDVHFAQNKLDNLNIITNNINYVRDLVTEPGNVIYPQSFMEKCLELSKIGLKVRALDVNEMRKYGMGSLLAVAQGSVNAPYLVILEWWGNSQDISPLAIVGKGVTFDSGGINLKGSNHITDMKYDMAGAGVVAGLMKHLAEIKVKQNVIGFLGLVENMPSGSAQRPGDVVRSMSGQTIEVDNTDAEGRMVLADAMWFAQTEYKCKTIIDLATLTGAVSVAVGDEFAGLFSNNDDLAKNLIDSGKKVNELLWRLPLTDHYDERINSDIADMRNTGRVAGCASASTAAHFLQRFLVNKENHWAHLDIAGVAWSDNGDLTDGLKGATGYGIRLLDHFINHHYKAI